MPARSVGLDMCPHIRFVYKVCRFIGMLSFTFNPTTSRVEHNFSRALISRIILEFIRIFCSVLFWVNFIFSLGWYLDIVDPPKFYVSYFAQEELLKYLTSFSEYTAIWIISARYISMRQKIVPLINGLFEIFELLRDKTDSALFLTPAVQMLLSYKLFFCLHQFFTNTSTYFWVVLFSYNVIGPYGELMRVLTFFGHWYSHLTLLCFYTKMHQFLDAAPAEMTESEFSKYILEVLAISRRIYQVKRDLNSFFSALFMSTYLGLFADIGRLYIVVKLLIFKPHNPTGFAHLFEIMVMLNFMIPQTLLVSYDIYLIGRLSDLLIEAEAALEHRIFLLINKYGLFRSAVMNRSVNQFLMQKHIYNIQSEVCSSMRIDQRFSFMYITDIIFIYVIICLQFYVSETVNTGMKVKIEPTLLGRF